MKWANNATWDDVPHLTQAVKDELWKSIPPYQRKARSKGIPVLGAGLIYPMDEEQLKVPDFLIPDFWKRGYAMDVGWNATAGVHMAYDAQNDILYVYRVYKHGGMAEGTDAPPIHAMALKAPGEWIPGVIDPAARGRNQKDGSRLMSIYEGLGLILKTAPNSVESGLYDVWMRMTTGRLKVFASCGQWFDEFRRYRRREGGQIVKEHDHLMDCTRYRIAAGVESMIVKPAPKSEQPKDIFAVSRHRGSGGNHGWLR